jgi:hypothetical protein
MGRSSVLAVLVIREEIQEKEKSNSNRISESTQAIRKTSRGNRPATYAIARRKAAAGLCSVKGCDKPTHGQRAKRLKMMLSD